MERGRDRRKEGEREGENENEWVRKLIELHTEASGIYSKTIQWGGGGGGIEETAVALSSLPWTWGDSCLETHYPSLSTSVCVCSWPLKKLRSIGSPLTWPCLVYHMAVRGGCHSTPLRVTLLLSCLLKVRAHVSLTQTGRQHQRMRSAHVCHVLLTQSSVLCRGQPYVSETTPHLYRGSFPILL